MSQVTDGKQFIHYLDNGNSETILVFNGDVKVYFNGYLNSQTYYIGSRGTGSVDLFKGSDDNFSFVTNITGVHNHLGIVGQLKSANINIYNDTTFNSVFYHAPSPYVIRTITAVEELPQTMKTTLVDGGLLSVALKVLAILLGVSLVVRWVYLFVRSKS